MLSRYLKVKSIQIVCLNLVLTSNPREWIPSWYSRNLQHFMETDILLLCSQEPDESSPRSILFLKIYFNIYLRLGLTSGFFSLGIPTNSVGDFLHFHACHLPHQSLPFWCDSQSDILMKSITMEVLAYALPTLQKKNKHNHIRYFYDNYHEFYNSRGRFKAIFFNVLQSLTRGRKRIFVRWGKYLI
jgi:hypothetical protein